MALESFSYITSLNASNPVHATDQVSVGDDHLRGVKTTLLNSFPNVNAAVNLTPAEFNYLDGVTGVTGSGNLALSAGPTLTGTLTAAIANFSGAVTALSYGGITEANLLDKSATETVSGAWTFGAVTAGAITATSYGSVLEANLLDKTAPSELISGAGWQFSAALRVASLEVGHASDTSITRDSAGKIAVEGRAILAHEDASFTSSRVHFSDGVEPTSEGDNGDIFLVY